MDFCVKPVSHTNLFKFLAEHSDQWVFRGQWCGYRLESTLERACLSQGMDLKESAPKVESEMVRQFRRAYDGNDREDVRVNTLYCLSLMRHYGAPTRLLDWTYSKYVAAYFALESALNKANRKELNPQLNCAIWALNGKWCEREAIRVAGDEVEKRGLDRVRSNPKLHEKSLRELYLKNLYSFVLPENPYYFHQRLQIQQAVHLCPGNVSIGVEDNLKRMNDWEKESAIIKYVYEARRGRVLEVMEILLRMNISRKTLFPGLSGLAESLQYPLKYYEKIHDMHDRKRSTT